MSAPHIGLFGSYYQGNYGDDLMAMLFAIEIEQRGARPLIYRGPERLCRERGWDRTDSLQELVERTRCVVFGGGGLLTSKARHMGYTSTQEFAEECFVLTETAERAGRSIYVISVGGDGHGIDTPLDYGVTRLLHSDAVKGTTVRLRDDLLYYEKLRRPAHFFPDVLWNIGRYVPAEKNPPEKRRPVVGLNLKMHPLVPWYVRALRWKCAVDRTCEPRFFRTIEAERSGASDFHPADMRGVPVYSDPVSFTQEIWRCDAVLSSKLHFGLIALAGGVPFISIYGPGKAHQFLRELGFGNWIVAEGRRPLVRFVRSHLMPFSRRLLERPPGFKETIARNIEGAAGHLEMMHRWLDAEPA